jgi:hypothetical protein
VRFEGYVNARPSFLQMHVLVIPNSGPVVRFCECITMPPNSDDSDDDVAEVAAPVQVGVESLLKNDDENTLRVLLSTDNHLGYAERDSVRGMDSFAAFEEVLYLAKRFHCDMVRMSMLDNLTHVAIECSFRPII